MDRADHLIGVLAGWAVLTIGVGLALLAARHWLTADPDQTDNQLDEKQ